jgi:HD superfamily phosphohydrolase
MSYIEGEHRVRDSVHGYIKLTDEERNIIDSDYMQRLRRVGQMGMSSLVYPSATHTRFSHSIGVMYVAGEFAKSLDMSNKMYRTIRIAGLIHDVGHGPFSHTSDRVAQRHGYTHEENSCRILEENLSSFIPDDISIRKLKNQILGEADVNIIAGNIDADRIDYLNRDAVNTGLEHGTIDYQTIIEFSDIDNGRLVFDRKATYALTELLTARLYMHNAITNHHVARLAETILERCIERYVDDDNIIDMMSCDDYVMHNNLLNSDKQGVSELYSRVINRDLPKRAYSVRGDSVPKDVIDSLSSIDAQEYEKKIADSTGISNKDVFIVTPAIARSEPSNLKIRDNGNIKDMSELSNIPSQLANERSRQTRFHVYTNENNVKEVSDVADNVLGDII